VRVLTFDADASDGREFFVNQCEYDEIARTVLDSLAAETGGKGKVGMLTSTLQAPNQSEWARRMRRYQAEKYPAMELLPEVESQENTKIGVERARDMIQANPDLRGIVGLTSVAFLRRRKRSSRRARSGRFTLPACHAKRDAKYLERDRQDGRAVETGGPGLPDGSRRRPVRRAR
jgi:hypothetical protein